MWSHQEEWTTCRTSFLWCGSIMFTSTQVRNRNSLLASISFEPCHSKPTSHDEHAIKEPVNKLQSGNKDSMDSIQQVNKENSSSRLQEAIQEMNAWMQWAE
jgi:hypothetical protein